MAQGAPLASVWLGRTRYGTALALQRLLVSSRRAARRDLADSEAVDLAKQISPTGLPSTPAASLDAAPRLLLPKEAHEDVVLALEHPPTYTVGRRIVGDWSERDRLRALGAEYFEGHQTHRGGKITFHGPGQLVVYPIIDLRRFGLGVRAYVEALQQALIRTCAVYDITANLTNDVGVWVQSNKIAAIGCSLVLTATCLKHQIWSVGGVSSRAGAFNGHFTGIQVANGITSHGIALNCTTDLSWFAHIVPCGLVGKGVTSLQQETRARSQLGTSLDPERVLPVFMEQLAQQIGARSCVADKLLHQYVHNLLHLAEQQEAQTPVVSD